MKYQAIAITYQLECLLKKARKESFACIFLSAGCSDSRGDISIMAGFGIAEQFFDLSDVPQCPANPVMGYLGYDYKNQIEPSLKTDQPQLVEFESLKFVIPKAWVAVEKNGGVSGDESLLLDARADQNTSDGRPFTIGDVFVPKRYPPNGNRKRRRTPIWRMWSASNSILWKGIFTR